MVYSGYIIALPSDWQVATDDDDEGCCITITSYTRHKFQFHGNRDSRFTSKMWQSMKGNNIFLQLS